MSIIVSIFVVVCSVQFIDVLDDVVIVVYLVVLFDWKIDGGKLVCSFVFGNYYEILVFVNVIVWIIYVEDYYLELIVIYNCCNVKFDIYSVNEGCGGLLVNDFICVVKVDVIFVQCVLV